MALVHSDVGMGKAPHRVWAKEDYWEDPSVKLSCVVAICRQHLKADNRLPLMVDPETRDVLIENQEEYPSPLVYDLPPAHRSTIAAPDKIVIYTCFSLQSMYIQHVLHLCGFEFLFYSANQSMQERAASLEAFRWSGRDGPRVLILSGMDIHGLNIACVNILVIVVSPLAVLCQMWLITLHRTPCGPRKMTASSSVASGSIPRRSRYTCTGLSRMGPQMCS